MGWDFYATRNGERLSFAEGSALFSDLEPLALKYIDSHDWLLPRGGLDVSTCARAIETMTGKSAWSDWTTRDLAEAFATMPPIEKLEELYELKNNPDAWAFYSAFLFLQRCKELGLGAEASF